MIRFFEPESNSRWLASAPPPPPLNISAAAPVESPAVSLRRTSSLIATVNLIKNQWHPSTSPDAFSAAGSLKNGFSGGGGGGAISWQDSGVFHRQASDQFSETFQGRRSSSMDADTRGRSNQHDMLDWRKRGNIVNEEENKKMEDPKRQKIIGAEKLYFQPSFNPSSSNMRATINYHTVKEPVKNQKLGDKITALQQLVSPFGKTDTASVLQEATIYIKALHEQINFQLLSRPHLETNSSTSIQGNGGGRSRLHERGLCIIPISSAIISLANQECPDNSMRELINQLN